MQKDSSENARVNKAILHDNDKSTYEKVKKKVKQAIFGVLFVLLKEEKDVNILLYIIPALFDFFQILQFVFHDKINVLWNANDVFKMVFNFFSFFNLGKYLGGLITWPLYLSSFYFFIILIMIVLIDIIYVSISFNRKKFTAIWPLIILRNFVNIAVTFLFLFITESLLSMIGCNYNSLDMKYHHETFPDIVCFQGVHILHTALSILFNIIFMTISLIVALNFYESRISTGNRLARSNSHAEVSFILNKIILQIVFSFLNLKWILVSVLFIGSIVMAYYYIVDDPYYDSFISKFHKATSSIYLWSCTVLLILKIFETSGFSNGFVLWGGAIPFICLISVTYSRYSLSTLTKANMKFKSASEQAEHLQYVLKLVEQSKMNTKSFMLLQGYIQKHIEVCEESFCPLRNAAENKKRSEFTAFEEALPKVFNVIETAYRNGLKKYKRSVRLRISFSFFLLERTSNKKGALDELMVAEELHPTFEEEFLIFRYKKIIEDNLNDNKKGESEVDIVGLIAFETHVASCVTFIKKSTEYHRDFWSELLKPKPDLIKVNVLGININFTIRKVKENWSKLVKINSNMPHLIKLYSKFQSQVLNEREESRKLMEKFKELMIKQHEAEKNRFMNDRKMTNSQALIFTGSINGEVGYIKRVNEEFTSIFGYTSTESINKRIELIIPEIYKTNHSRYLNEFISHNNSHSSYIDNNQSFFGKSKAGFIFPIKCKTSYFGGDSQRVLDMTFVTSIKKNNKSPTKMFLLTNKNGNIQEISANTMIYLNLTPDKINERRINVTTYMPKALVVLDYRVKGKIIEIELSSGDKAKALCMMKPIMLRSYQNSSEDAHEMSLEGFLATIEILSEIKINRNIMNEIDNSIKETESEAEADIWTFIGNPYQQYNLTKHIKHKKNTLVVLKSLPYQETQFIEEKINTKRLHNGDIVDREEDKMYNEGFTEGSDVIKEDIYTSIFKEKIPTRQINSDETTKARRDQLEKAIELERKSSRILIYKLLTILWTFISIVLCVFQLYDTFDNYKSLDYLVVKMITKAKSIDLLTNIMEVLTTLEYVKRGIYYHNVTDSDRFDIIKRMNDEIANYTSTIIENNRLIVEFPDKLTSNMLAADIHSQFNFNITNMINSSNMPESDINKLMTSNIELKNAAKEEMSPNNVSPSTIQNKLLETTLESVALSLSPLSIVIRGTAAIGTSFRDIKIVDRRNEKYEPTVPRFETGNNGIFDINKNEDIAYTIENYHDFQFNDVVALLLITQESSYTNNEAFMDDIILIRDKIQNTILISYQQESVSVLNLFTKTYNKRYILDNTIIITMLFIILVTAIFIIYMLLLLKYIQRKTERILILFLDIPRKELKVILSRCEIFMNYNNNLSLDDKNTAVELDDSSGDEEDDFDKQLKHRSEHLLKNNGKNTNYINCNIIRFS